MNGIPNSVAKNNQVILHKQRDIKANNVGGKGKLFSPPIYYKHNFAFSSATRRKISYFLLLTFVFLPTERSRNSETCVTILPILQGHQFHISHLSSIQVPRKIYAHFLLGDQ